jgi:hypothetical protein
MGGGGEERRMSGVSRSHGGMTAVVNQLGSRSQGYLLGPGDTPRTGYRLG